MTINLKDKIQQVAINRMLADVVYTLEVIYEQDLSETVYTSNLTPIYVGARWSIMEVDFTAYEMEDGQAHYKLMQAGDEILNGRMNIKLI